MATFPVQVTNVGHGGCAPLLCGLLVPLERQRPVLRQASLTMTIGVPKPELPPPIPSRSRLLRPLHALFKVLRHTIPA